MSSITITIAQIDATTAVTRRRDGAPVARPAAVTANGYRATTGTGLGTEGTAVSAGTWTAIRKPMTDVDFHDRWPLRSTL